MNTDMKFALFIYDLNLISSICTPLSLTIRLFIFNNFMLKFYLKLTKSFHNILKRMIVLKLLPIKAHFFLFMAALGPVLPQLQIYGKQLGISSVIMGTLNGILPLAYLLAKPIFGMTVDIHREHRKTIFMSIIIIMAVSYGCITLIPLKKLKNVDIEKGQIIQQCTEAGGFIKLDCYNSSNIFNEKFTIYSSMNNTICIDGFNLDSELNLKCIENNETSDDVIIESLFFWSFVLLLSVGTIAFNVINSISDAVCFDVIGDEFDYGKQRTWGSIGYGITAFLSGYAMDKLPPNLNGYRSAFCIMIIFIIFDLISCMKLNLPIIPVPQNIWKDLGNLIRDRTVFIFLIFTVIAGISDGFLTYFLLWYVEDIAKIQGAGNTKILEGLIVAAESFGGEILFFYVGDNILKKLGHINCFSLSLLCFALRLGLISIVTSPWIIILIEFLLQGPTYALSYLTIVAYANEIAPLGASATMQGIAAGLDDGLGYAIGSFVGGILYHHLGPRETFRIFAGLSAISGIFHYVLNKVLSAENDEDEKNEFEANYVNVSQV